MAGIVGFVDRSLRQEKEINIKEMNKKQKHRGVDIETYYIDSEIALGFRERKTFSYNIEQPIYNETGKMLILFDGEIFNAKELREELKQNGHIFNTDSHAEIVLHGYEQYEINYLKKIRGTFAFVIWDTQTNTLIGARDMFGIKPLYYTEMNGSLIFASEIKSILAHQSINRRLNYNAVKPFLLFQYSVLPETLFKTIRKLEPGNCFTYQKGVLKIMQYFVPEFHNDGKIEEQYLDEIGITFKKLFDDYNCEKIPTGTLLSDKIDSKYMTYFVNPTKTFSVGYDQAEIKRDIEISSSFNIENVSRLITPDDMFAKISEIQYCLDEPIADLSVVSLYYLMESAKKNVKVLFASYGADELFAGYDSYIIGNKDITYKNWVPRGIKKFLGNMAKTNFAMNNRNFYMRNGLDVEDYYIGETGAFSEYEAKNILIEEYKDSPNIKDITKLYYGHTKNNDEITRKQYIDLNFILPQNILPKLDRISNYHCMELSLPYLDYTMWNLASGIPNELKTKNAVPKYLLHESFKKLSSDSSPKKSKVTISSPFSAWIKEEKYMNIVKEQFEEYYVRDIFDQQRILKLLNDHYTNKCDNAEKIWTIYSFLVWYNVYFIEQR